MSDASGHSRPGRALATVTAAVLAGTLLAAGAPGVAAPPAPAASAPAGRPALSVTLVSPSPANLALKLAANGNIAAWQEASIGSQAQGLRLEQVRVQVGDVVKAGQVLAVFASDTVQADLAQVRAALAEAEAALAEARANAQRARDLQNSGAISAQQIQQWLTGERVAEARVQAQKAAVQAQELRLRQTEVRSPDRGVISARPATVGAVVANGQELFRLIRQSRLEWRAEVGADALGSIRPGMAATVQLPGGSAVSGRVRSVAPTVDAATRNGIVFVDLAADSAARAGMFARGEFDLGARTAMSLPQSAVVLREGFSYVYRVGPDARVQELKVQTGRRQADRVEILSGLAADARVVATGGAFLADGDLVRVVAAPATPAPAAAPR